MKRYLLAGLCCLALGLLPGCRSPEASATSDIRSEWRVQMRATRAQLQAAGASAKELREFDQAMELMDKTMRQMEKQMRALE